MAEPAAPTNAPTSAPRHGPSLRRQLLQPLAWVWALGMLLALAGALLLARASANSAFDRGLQDEVAALAGKLVWSDRGPLLDLTRQAMELITWDSDDRNAFVMVDQQGQALAGDAAVPLPTAEQRARSVGQPTLFDSSFQGDAVRGAVFTLMGPMLDRQVSLVLVETTRRRSAAVRDILLGMVLPSLAMGAATFAALAWSIRRGLQPLRDVAAEVARRAPRDWRPLALGQVPAEAVPLIARINTLLSNAEQSVVVQRRFIADAAHQLRTPVAGMRVLLQELAHELAHELAQDLAQDSSRVASAGQASSAPAWPPLLAQLRASSDRMARLIGQLLSLARSETALALDAEHRLQDIVAPLRAACEPLVLQALADGRSIALDAPASPVPACVHALWFGEVLVNLLDNALRYGGTHILVQVRPLPGGGAEVVVQDDGPGVLPDELPRLFEPFWRGERADRRNDGGTGLGLTIAHEIMQRLGGSLAATSRPQVPGLRFTLRLAG